MVAKSIVSTNDIARVDAAKLRETLLRRSPDEISACEIVRESFLQPHSPNTTTRSLSPVTGVRPAAFRRMRDVYEEYNGKDEGGRTRKRAKGEETHVREAEREKTDTERWTNGPPRLRAIMSRSRKLAAPSSIMPSSCAITCSPVSAGLLLSTSFFFCRVFSLATSQIGAGERAELVAPTGHYSLTRNL